MFESGALYGSKAALELINFLLRLLSTDATGVYMVGNEFLFSLYKRQNQGLDGHVYILL